MTKSGTKVINYDNRYTRQSNHLILRIVDNAKNTVNVYKVETVFGGTKNVNLDENKGFTSESDIVVFKPTTAETVREKEVLELRFGLFDGSSHTLEEVGKQFKVTRERIRQIEAKALRKLRHPSRAKKLKDFLIE